jgi:hypothetical protein
VRVPVALVRTRPVRALSPVAAGSTVRGHGLPAGCVSIWPTCRQGVHQRLVRRRDPMRTFWRSSAIRSRRGGVGHAHSDIDSEGADQQPQVQQQAPPTNISSRCRGRSRVGLGQPAAAFAPVTGNGNSRWIQAHPRHNSSRARR